jgi:acetolactate synthase-1/2/3 large subunit
MGWALPAAIGGALSTQARRATCLVGDGSIMMNLQELATLTSARTDIVIFLLNNLGYGMVRQTEAQWLDSQNVGTNSGTGGLHFPEFSTLSKAFGLRYLRMDSEADIRGLIATAYQYRSCLVEVAISPSARVVPQARYGFPIEDGEPSLDRTEFASNMLIATHLRE